MITTTSENASDQPLAPYSFKKDGFVVLRQFFSNHELDNIRRLVNDRVAEKKRENEANPYPMMSASFHDVLMHADTESSPEVRKILKTIEEILEHKFRLHNSLYVELDAGSIATAPGLPWHQDVASFAVLEKGTPALFSWFALENTLDGSGGMLDFIPRHELNSIAGMNLDERSINVVETAWYAKKRGVDFTKHGKYMLWDIFTDKVVKFLNEPLDAVALTPALSPGDLLLSEKDILHRTSPTTARSGRRTAITTRFADCEARYSGCLDDGIPAELYRVYEGSKLWQRLHEQKRGARIFP